MHWSTDYLSTSVQMMVMSSAAEPPGCSYVEKAETIGYSLADDQVVHKVIFFSLKEVEKKWS